MNNQRCRGGQCFLEPHSAYGQFDSVDKSNKVYLVWECMVCGRKQVELHSDVTGFGLAQIITIKLSIEEEGFVVARIPY
jgi:hypothetical protein